MRGSGMNYFPVAWPFLLAIGLLLVLAIIVLEIRVLRYAYEKVGLSPRAALAVLLLSFFGSYINIPVAELGREPVLSGEVVEFRGVHYVVPVVEEWPRTVLAVNLGGAVIPTFVSLYLLVKYRLYLRALIATAVVAAVVHMLAQPVRGVGIAVPIFIPPLVAAAAALLIGWRHAPPLAYIAGSMGALIGADLLNLNKIEGLGAPVASIGGAGTFDGIFVTGVLAALLTPLTSARTVESTPEWERRHGTPFVGSS